MIPQDSLRGRLVMGASTRDTLFLHIHFSHIHFTFIFYCYLLDHDKTRGGVLRIFFVSRRF